ncbi:MAG: hypothetical protein AAF958_03405 [Planctomycetota bacterium]
MPLPPWSVELLRRSLSDVAAKASPEMIEKLKSQATAILNELPAAAARGVDSVMQATETTKRSVQSWARSYTATSRHVINASGNLMVTSHHGLVTPPLSAVVLEAGMEFLDGSRLAGPGLEHRGETALARWSNLGSKPDRVSVEDHGLVVTASLDAAVIAMALTAGDHPIRLHRSQAITLPSGKSIPDLLESLGIGLQEFGGIDGFAADSYPDDKASLYVFAEGGSDGRPETRSIPAGIRGDVLPVAAWCREDLPPAAKDIASVEDAFTRGADAVVFSPSPLAGGPACGVLVAKEEALAKLKKHRLWPLLRSSEVARAMTVTALNESPLEAADSAASLLTLSIDNLKSRAEKLKIRLEACGNVETVQRIDSGARIYPRSSHRIDSQAVQVRFKSRSTDDLLQSLAKHETYVALAQPADGDAVVIDLRWVPPSDDSKLADVLESVIG